MPRSTVSMSATLKTPANLRRGLPPIWCSRDWPMHLYRRRRNQTHDSGPRKGCLHDMCACYRPPCTYRWRKLYRALGLVRPTVDRKMRMARPPQCGRERAGAGVCPAHRTKRKAKWKNRGVRPPLTPPHGWRSGCFSPYRRSGAETPSEFMEHGRRPRPECNSSGPAAIRCVRVKYERSLSGASPPILLTMPLPTLSRTGGRNSRRPLESRRHAADLHLQRPLHSPVSRL